MPELEIDRIRRELAMRNAELAAYKEYANRISAMKPPEPLRLTTITQDIILKTVQEAEERGYQRGMEAAAKAVDDWYAQEYGRDSRSRPSRIGIKQKILALMDAPKEEKTDD